MPGFDLGSGKKKCFENLRNSGRLKSSNPGEFKVCRETLIGRAEENVIL